MEREPDLNDPLERLAAKARQEEPPAIRVSLATLAPRFTPVRAVSPARWLLLSAAAPAMAACLMVALALQSSTAATTSTSTATPTPARTVTDTAAPSTDPAAALFAPLQVELP
jgi:hypothetical protein